MKKIELDDRSASGKQRPWKKHKKNNEKVINALLILDERNKAHKIELCGNVLVFGACPNGHGQWLKDAHFCQDRVCSLCNYRKSLFQYHQVHQVSHKVLELHPKIVFLFQTLTVENCKPEELSGAITHLNESYARYIRFPAIKKAFLGTFRTLEITYNPLTNTFHPHIHSIIAVSKSYFQGSYYLSQAELTDLWQKALKVSYKPICDIRRVKSRKKGIPTDTEAIRKMDAVLSAGAAAEVAKYAAKVGDILAPISKPSDSFEMKEAKAKLRANPKKQAEILGHLIKALHHRRLVAYTGVFKEAYKALNCKDVEDSDLILLPGEERVCECPVCRSELVQLHYVWNGNGYFMYEGGMTCHQEKITKFGILN
jgi:plasmid rolling circle replication initiator protein Rep